MKRVHKTGAQNPEHLIARSPSPSPKEMEFRINRVWERLGSENRLRSDADLKEHHTPRTDWHSNLVKRPTLRHIPVLVAVTLVIAVAWIGIKWESHYGTLETAGGSRRWIFQGATLGTNGGILALRDGSRLEIRPMSELSLERAADGVRIRLSKGSIIVNAAKQPRGHLYVQTKDMTVTVVGTVFVVKAEESGSRVAVVEGQVEVRQGGTEKQLGAGEGVTTSRLIELSSLREEISWSRRAREHLALLAAAQRRERPEFESAAVYPSPLNSDRGGHVQMEGGQVRAGRYEVRRATILDLITIAYDVERDAVIGGPNGLDWNRFDIVARVPANTRPDIVKLMLRSLLADRFNLVARTDTRPVPAYVLSRGTGPLVLKRASGTGDVGCRMALDRESVSCRNVTMGAYAEALQRAALTSRPVVNSTNLEGAWDFDLRYNARDAGIPDPSSRNTGIFDALQQVGLKLELRDVPRLAVVVESVNEKPAPTPPGVEAALPSAPAEFEVASLRPCTMPVGITIRVSPGGLVNTGCSTLDLLIKRAWNLEFQVQFAPQLVLPVGNRDAIPGLPERLGARGFQISARSPVELTGFWDANFLTMLQNLLIDRFKMVIHYEDQPKDVHVLVAVKPQLKSAEPSARSECRQSISPQQEVRGQILTCQNVTMAQFVERLRATWPLVQSESQGRVIDETGLSGAWNFTLTWADAPFGVPAVPRTAPRDNLVVSDPIARGITLFDAVEKQLGLKLERRKRPVPVLVVDHIEENPSEN
jgi:uncharacterized protein (TIGR03435 family)